MYVLTNENHVIEAISETLDHQENGNPLINDGTLAIAAYIVAHEYEVDAVPEGVTPSRWCYDGTDFYPNPDWVEPPPTVEERLDKLESEIESDEDIWAQMASAIDTGVQRA